MCRAELAVWAGRGPINVCVWQKEKLEPLSPSSFVLALTVL